MYLPLSIAPPRPITKRRRRKRSIVPSPRRFELLEERQLLAANLEIVSVSVPSSAEVGNGGEVEISWNVQNSGADPADAEFWFDSVYLSDDDQFDPFDELLTFVVVGPDELNDDNEYAQTQTLVLPNSGIGNKNILIVVDDGDLLAEDNEFDNISISPIELTGPDVDLTILDPPTLSPTVVIGQPFLLQWQVTNLGTDDAQGEWIDRITLSTDDFLDPDDEVLLERTRTGGIGDLATIDYSELLTLDNPAGTYYIFVETDRLGDQYETNDFNNGSATSFVLTTTGPNLFITSFDPPTELGLGSEGIAFFAFQNNESESAGGDVYAAVYLSDDDTLDDSDVLIGESIYTLDPALGLNEEYIADLPFLIPTDRTGNQYLIAVVDHRSQFGETDEFDNTAAVAITIGAPNLTIIDVDAPESANAGETIYVNANVRNDGTFASTADAWDDVVYLSEDETLDPTDLPVGVTTFFNGGEVGDLPQDGEYFSTVEVNLPSVLSGNYFLIFVTDDGNAQAELNEEDNYASVPIEIVGGLDVAVSDLDAPATVILGDTINVSYTVTNLSGSAINPIWFDKFFLSDDPLLDEGDTRVDPLNYLFETPLDSFGSTVVEQEINLSFGTPGTGKYLLVVIGDGFSDVHPDNNVAAFQLDVTAPDLDVTSFSAPTSVTSNESVTFSYAVENIGTATAPSDWSDAIYLSTDTVFDGTDRLVAFRSVFAETPLAPGAGYSRLNFSAGVPGVAAGQYYWILHVGGPTQPDADPANNMEVLGPVTVTVPDYEVSVDSAPSSAVLGDTVVVSYTVTNIAATATAAGFSQDQFWISDNAVFDFSDTFLQTETVLAGLPLGPGGSYSRTVNVALDSGTAGNKFLLIRVDATSAQFESNEANNIIAIPISLSAPDLTVENPVAPAQAAIGQTINISYTVHNIGAVPAYADWTDSIFLANSESDPGSIFLRDVTISSQTPLAADGTYVINTTVTIPGSVAAGSKFLRIITNRQSITQPEISTTNNSIYVPIEIVLESVDLAITNAVVPATIPSNVSTQISWEVTNQGTATAPADWFDQIYISSDMTVDVFDQTLAALSAASFSPLGPGGSYTQLANVVIPASRAGAQYILIVTDVAGTQAETNEGNNIIAIPITVQAPDLVVENVQVPASGELGTPFDVTYTLHNVGTSTFEGAWFDRIIVTNQATSEVVFLLDIPRSITIGAGQSETVSASITVPAAYPGDHYVVGIGTDIFDQIDEAIEDNNVGISAPIPLSLPETPDLAVSDIDGPIEGVVGQSFLLSWTITNNGVNTAEGPWTDRVRLVGSTTYDFGTFTTDTTLAPGESITRTQLLAFPAPPGSFVFEITTDFGGDVGEGLNEGNNVATIGPITIAAAPPPPDLIVTNIVTPPDGVFTTQTVPISFTVTNVSTSPTNVPFWRDYVFLSTDPNVPFEEGSPVDDISIFRQAFRPIAIANAAALGPGESYTQTVYVTIPQDFVGPVYVYAFPNGLGNRYPTATLTEATRSNNLTRSDAFDVTLTPPPDLQVTSVIAPPQVFSGQFANIQYTVTNLGTGPTSVSQWQDRVYLSTDDVLDENDILLIDNEARDQQPHSGVLGVGDSYTHSAQYLLPQGISGPMHVLVQTDAVGQVFEAGIDDNNVGATVNAILVNLTPPPDLEMEILAVPTSATNSRQVSITYRVTNNGATETPSTTTFDGVYLSTDAVLDDDDVFLQSRVGFTGVLAVGASYTRTQTVTLPNEPSGLIYLIVKADTETSVFELDRDNNAAAAAISVESVPADLVVAAPVLPASAFAASPINVTWTVTNQGVGDTAAAQWVDKIFLSRTGSLADAELIGTFVRDGILGPGQSTTRTESVVLPVDLPGTVYLFVVTDAIIDPLVDPSIYVPTQIFGNVFEGANEDNNASALTQLTIVNAPADLVVTSVSVPPTASTGESISVSWTVENQGTGPTSSSVWTDDVYISADGVLGAGDIFLGSVLRSAGLGVGESYQAEGTFKLPVDLAAGTFRILVETDRSTPRLLFDSLTNRVYEGSAEDNNVSASDPLTVTLSPVPELVVTTVDAPAEGVAGRPITINWTVTNDSTAPTPNQPWFDLVYLSADQIFDRPTETLLGYVEHKTPLGGGESYAQSLNVTLPAGLDGNFYVYVLTDGGNKIFEREGESNNAALDLGSVAIQPAPVVDLTIGTIIVPAATDAGREATISYTITNSSGNTALAPWSDSVYLSRDPVLDAGDALFARVQRTSNLGPGGSYTATITAPLPVTEPGEYYVIIRTDVFALVNESDETNNISASLDLASVEATPITLDEPLADTLPQGQFRLYRVDVPAGEALRVVWDSVAPNASTQLFVRYGQAPTRSIYDERYDTPFLADQEIIVPATRGGTYYILVYGERGLGDGSILAEVIPFSIQAVDLSDVGNAGSATFKVTGARFNRGTTFELIGPSGQMIPQSSASFEDGGSAYVTFDLQGADPGTYTLRGRQTTGQTTDLSTAVSIHVSLIGGVAATGVIAPPITLTDAVSTFTVTISNTGDNDIPAPIVFVVSPTQTNYGINSDQMPSDLRYGFYATSDEGPLGILRPGEISDQLFYFRAPSTAGLPYRFETYYYDHNSTTPIDWSYFEPLISGAVRARTDYSIILATLQSRIGPTMGDLVRAFSHSANVLPPGMGDPRDFVYLLDVQVRMAIASLGTSLAGSVIADDLDIPIAGQDVFATDVATGAVFATTSMADGSFLFPEIPAGTYRFTWEGAIVVSDPVVVPADTAVENAVVELTRGRWINGRIVDGLSAIDGANVRAVSEDGKIASVLSTASGSFLIPGLPPGIYTLIVEANGFARQIELGLDATTGDVELVVDLDVQSSIIGTVTLPPGGPTDTQMTVLVRSSDLSETELTFGFSTLGNGFEVGGLPGGTYDVTISRPGYATVEIAGVVVPDSGVLALGDIPLALGASVSGQLFSNSIDVDPGNQIVQARQGSTIVATTSTDEFGAFAFVDLAPGTYDIQVGPNVGFTASEQVTVAGGDVVSDLLLIVENGAVIQGTVFAAGTLDPLPGIPVRLAQPDGTYLQTTTDGSGNYQFTKLSLGDYLVTVPTGGFSNSSAVSITGPAETVSGIDLQVGIAAEIVGIVTQTGGIPLEGAAVVLTLGGATITSTSTNAEGEYRFLLQQAGLFNVSVLDNSATFVSADVDVSAGETEIHDFVSGSASISVTIREDGVDTAGAIRVADENGQTLITLLTDDDGALTLSNLTPGTYTIVATTDSARTAQTVVTIGDGSSTALVLNVVEVGSLTGTIATALGDPIDGAVLRLYFAGTSDLAAVVTTLADGSYELNGIADGSYDLVIAAPGYVFALQTGVTIAGATVRHAALAESTSSVSGTVVDGESGIGIPHANVTVRDASGRIIGESTTDAFGQFAITSAVGSNLTLAVSATGFAPANLSSLDIFAGSSVAAGAIAANAVAIGATEGLGGSILGAPEVLEYLARGDAGFASLLANATATTRGQSWLQTLTQIFEEAKEIYESIQKEEVPELPDCSNCKPQYTAALVARGQMLIQAEKLVNIGTDMIKQVVRFGAIAIGEADLLVFKVIAILGLAEGWALLGTAAGAEALVGAQFAPLLLEWVGGWNIGSAIGSLITAINSGWKFATDIPNVSSKADLEQQNQDMISAFSNALSAGTSLGQLATNQIDPQLGKALGPFTSQIGTLINLISSLLANPFANTFNQAEVVDSIEKKFRQERAKLDELQRDFRKKLEDYVDCLALDEPGRVKRCECQNGDCGDHGGGPGGPGGPGGGGGGTSGRRFDPNDIIGPAGFSDAHYVPGNSTLDYTIRFENLNTATLPVQNLVVQMQLDSDLDFRTFRLGSFGWSNQEFDAGTSRPFLNERIDLLDTLGIYVDVNATIDISTGLVTWTLQAIDPATGLEPVDDAIGFLPPDDDAGLGEGFVRYSVRPKASVQTGDVIDAEARIFFDTEAPVDTPAIFNTIDADVPTSQVNALPAESTDEVLVEWIGSDGVEGSGIASFDIYVATGGGPFTLWLDDTTLSSALFAGQPGVTYAFLSIARDNAGNVEAAPPVADATTTFAAPGPALSIVGPDRAARSAPTTIQFVVENLAPTIDGGYGFLIDWDNDGTYDRFFFGPNGMSVQRTFTALGYTTYHVLVVDAEGTVFADATETIEIVPSLLTPNADNQTLLDLPVGGTAGDDHYVVEQLDPTTVRLTILVENGVAVNQSFVFANVTGKVRISGGGGNDILDARGLTTLQADLRGDAGNDTIYGGAADDYIDADGAEGTGNDVVYGGDGNDLIYGDGVKGRDPNDTGGRDTIYGEGGNDTIYADGSEGSNSDLVYGGDGDDTVYADGSDPVDEHGSFGKDTIFAGDGNDVVVAHQTGGAPDVINGEDGDDLILAGSGKDTISGGVGIDVVFAGSGADSVTGGPGSDLLISERTSGISLAAAQLVRAEWRSLRPIEDRVANLTGTGVGPRENGSTFLIPGATVLDDNSVDSVLGNEGEDWFLADLDEDILSDVDAEDRLLDV